ncbi:integrin alpha-3 [Hemibagrus wyckioides]|uniref:integrin alpha-3 n=1 Tax=Hemibagrus wyckioides TaxID=337641 RepID=UPI00266C5DE0|nr:integrin alpha-3 [Hemibagrus wyckioides]
MTSQLPRVLTVPFVLLCFDVCAGFNLDSRFAVVKEGGTPGSLFGLSVAMHRQTVGSERYLLLVGAPQEKAEPTLRANQTGDMYACPITTNPKDCIRANLISSDTVDPEDVIEGMWLGVSVVSQSSQKGRVMACGHRYSRSMENGVNLRMIGKCYIRGNDLKFDEENDSQWQYRQEVCKPNGNHLMEGMCNMGISATMTETEVVAGAPGCYNWQGNSYVVYRNPDDIFDTEIIKLQDLGRGNIYIGYSVGKENGILSKYEDTVVAGAPRYNSKGSVVLMEVIRNNDGSTELKELNVMLQGEQVGSYFGNSIAIIDINNDGWKELIVGAPFYFDRRSEEGGAVYVFMNENGSFKPKTDLRFTGLSNSGFGMAVSSIGDVNQDGFLDFAVGAPFHGSGRVYVWMGGKDKLSSSPDQVIEGKDVSNGGFKTFGYSISGGLDVDGNKYPDIVVGSLDDRVALLRARPVIHVKKTFTVTPSIIDPNNCESCIKVEVCFSYTLSTGESNFKEDIVMNYTVEADVLPHSSQTRVRFDANDKNMYTGLLSMTKQHCETQTLKVIKLLRNKVTPVVFSLKASILEPQTDNVHQQKLQNLNKFPVLSQGRTLTDKAEVHFQKACGADNKCESNLQISATFAKLLQDILPVQDGHQVLRYDSSIKKLLLLVNVTNFPSLGRLAEDAHNTELNVSFSSSLIYSAVRTETSSVVNCAPAGDFILCDLGNPLATNQMVAFVIIFETSFISIDDQEITSTLQLSTLSIQDDLMPLTKVLLVDYTLQTSFQVVPSRVQTEFSGHVIGESAIKTTSQIGSPVEFKFLVNIDTPLKGKNVFYIDFNWPMEVANGKWLLYLEEITMSGTSEPRCIPPGNIVNPVKFEVSERKSSRRKRDEQSVAHLEALSSLNLKSARRKTDHLNCTSGTAKCTTFRCFLHNMTTTATVTVRSRLWNSTMLEDYNEASLILINGEATLKLKTDSTMIHLDNKTNSVTFSVEVTPAIQDEVESNVPLWIIIISALAGVLLLALIIVLLWKCGFFRRANTREIYEAKSQKAEMRTQPSEKDRLTEEE